MAFPAAIRRSTKNLPLVPIVSAPIQPDASCQYADLPHFSHFGDSVRYVGGINAPKLIHCYDSHGHAHMQLVSSVHCSVCAGTLHAVFAASYGIYTMSMLVSCLSKQDSRCSPCRGTEVVQAKAK